MPEVPGVPSDETPLVSGDNIIVSVNGIFTDRLGRPTGLQADAVEREVSDGLAAAIDTTAAATQELGDEIEAEIKQVYERNAKTLDQIYNSLAKPVEASMLEQQDAGIKTAWGAGERAADLTDPSMLSFVQRLEQSEPGTPDTCYGDTGQYAPDQCPGTPPPPPPPTSPPISPPPPPPPPTSPPVSPPPPPLYHSPPPEDDDTVVPVPPDPDEHHSPPPECVPWTVTVSPTGDFVVFTGRPTSPPPGAPVITGISWPNPLDPAQLLFLPGSGWYDPMPAGVSLHSGPIPTSGYSRVGSAGPCPVPPPPPPPTRPPDCPPERWDGEDCHYEPGTPTGPGDPEPGGKCCPPAVVNVTYPPPVPPTSPPAAPKPPPPARGVDRRMPTSPLADWDDTRACNVTLKLTGDGGEQGEDDVILPNVPSWLRTGVAGTVTSFLTTGPVGSVAAKLADWVLPNPTVQEEVSRQQMGASALRSLTESGMFIQCPNADFATGVAAKLGLVNWAETLTGMPLSYLATASLYQMQYACPQYLPSQSEVDALFLRDLIQADLWECYTKAQGNLPKTHALVRDAKASIPGDEQVTALYLRGKIPSLDEYLKRMRALGYVDQSRALEILELSKFVPPYTDLLRMMVRDAADPAVVAKYGYDKDFESKFAGPLKTWADAQGIESDVFRYIWRSHWQIPSNTQLYTALHRLRPDRPEVVEADAAIAAAAAAGVPPAAFNRPPVVTTEDVRYALEVNDVAPTWVDAMIAVSYHPITNTDARRAYMIGFKDKTWLRSRMQDNGYNVEDATLLADFYAAERERTITTQTGVMSARKVMQAYRNGELTRGEADGLLVDMFPDEAVRSRQLDKANIETIVEVKRSRIKAIKKRYVYGEVTALEVQGLLSDAGVQPDQQFAIIARMDADKFGHRKEPRVTMLCDWFQKGLLTEQQYFERLDRLGYAADDAGRIVASCRADFASKVAKQAIQAADRERREQRQRLTDYKKLIADAEKRLKELEKQAKEAEASQGGGGQDQGEG